MKTFRAAMLAVALPALALLAGCEWGHNKGWDADFSNLAKTAMDVYRNGDLQFTLQPGADGSCRVDGNDVFAVLDHPSQQTRGTYNVNISDNVGDFQLTAVIYDDHVDWSTNVQLDSTD